MSNGLGAETDGSLSTGVPVDVFLHIPKTAGVSVRWALRRQYRETGYLHLALPDPSEVSPSPIADTISLEGAKRRLADSRSEPFGVVFGHMPFGIHEALTRPVRYFTMVRNPVERVVSQYYFVTTRQHALHRAVESGMTLHDYVTSGVYSLLANGQTALLAGRDQGVSSDDTAVLRRAKANIEAHFVAAGLAEDFDRSLALFALALGWKKAVIYETRNVTVGRLPVSQLPRKTIEEIEDRNQLDEGLYRFIRERFEAQIEAAGVALTRELWKLRVANAVHRHDPRGAARRAWDLARSLRARRPPS